MMILTLLLLLLPFIPGLRSIPKWIPIHRLIWRDYYRGQRKADHLLLFEDQGAGPREYQVAVRPWQQGDHHFQPRTTREAPWRGLEPAS